MIYLAVVHIYFLFFPFNDTATTSQMNIRLNANNRTSGIPMTTI